MKNLTFEPQAFSVLIGANGQGKSLIFEALYRFFVDFNPIAGGASAGLSDSLWFRREAESPIKFEIDLVMDKTELRQYLPLDKSYFDTLDEKVNASLHKLKIKRSLSAQGSWMTELLQWGDIPLVENDVLISPDKLSHYLAPESFKDYKMYFFTQGNSQENIGGDRLLVDTKRKKAFTSTPQIDQLVSAGLIESSTENAGQNYQEWGKKEKILIASPSASEVPILGILSPETLQKIISGITQIRTKFKLIPAARDVKTSAGQRVSLVEPTVLQNITAMSIDRRRPIEKSWEQYRAYLQQLLNRRVEPNPNQVLLKEGDLGLQPSEIGGGEQSIMGIVKETFDVNAILIVEEPEIHLHPKLQRLLLSYLRELSSKTQVMVSSHSPIFASKLDLAGVFIVSKDEEGRTTVEQVNEGNVNRIIDELGIKPADILDYDTVVFVEGQDDVKIFNAWARRFKSSGNIGFIDTEGWNNMEYYANARILGSRRIKVTPFVIFDGDTEDGKLKDVKDKLVKQLDLREENINTLKADSIEDYLLVPIAILRAFPNFNLSEKEIESFLESYKTKKDRKVVLDLLLKRGGIQGYNGDLGAQIALNMRETEISGDIREIFKRITASPETDETALPEKTKTK
ncbi:MAG: AAA family ATPase [Thaumarchaeota archaeon]|nr:AAA family ATPase [Nitrososphaerota archaeon]